MDDHWNSHWKSKKAEWRAANMTAAEAAAGPGPVHSIAAPVRSSAATSATQYLTLAVPLGTAAAAATAAATAAAAAATAAAAAATIAQPHTNRPSAPPASAPSPSTAPATPTTPPGAPSDDGIVSPYGIVPPYGIVSPAAGPYGFCDAPDNLTAAPAAPPTAPLDASLDAPPGTSNAPDAAAAPTATDAAPAPTAHYSSPYNTFCHEQRPLLPEGLRSGHRQAEREKLLGQMWKALSEADRSKYKFGRVAYTSPYNVFCREQRPLLPPGLRNAERETLLGQMWTALSEAEWARYQAEAAVPGMNVPRTHRPPPAAPAAPAAPAVPLAIAVPYNAYDPPYNAYNLPPAPPSAPLAASRSASPPVLSTLFRVVPQQLDARGNTLPRPQDELCALPRSELQALAKAHGLRATQKTDVLVREVRARLDAAAVAAAAAATAATAAPPPPSAVSTPWAAPDPSAASHPSAANSGLDLLMSAALGF